jgi:hypothetical protein
MASPDMANSCAPAPIGTSNRVTPADTCFVNSGLSPDFTVTVAVPETRNEATNTVSPTIYMGRRRVDQESLLRQCLARTGRTHAMTIRPLSTVIGRITIRAFQMRPVPINQHVAFDDRLPRTGLERFDVRHGKL